MRTSNLTRIFGWDMVQATVPIMVGRNPDYYVEHGAYDGNTENMTALTFAEPVETRSMLVQVTVPNGGADQDVRLYELEVLAVDEDQVAARRVMAEN